MVGCRPWFRPSAWMTCFFKAEVALDSVDAGEPSNRKSSECSAPDPALARVNTAVAKATNFRG